MPATLKGTAPRSLTLAANGYTDNLSVISPFRPGTTDRTQILRRRTALTPDRNHVMSEIKRLRGLVELDANGQAIKIDLDGCAVTDADLAHLLVFPELQALDLTGRDITDEGLTCVTGLVELRHLWLSETRVTDRGVASLSGLRNLQSLSLYDTKVTHEAVMALERAIPGLAVWR
jgi:hypothetical protein